MTLGIVLIAMVAATAMSVALFLLSAPLWLVLLAYPVTGTVILLSVPALSDSSVPQQLRGNKPAFLARVTARFRAGQPPR